jgi:hypothetical protein
LSTLRSTLAFPFYLFFMKKILSSTHLFPWGCYLLAHRLRKCTGNTHRLSMWRWSFSGVRKLRDNSKPQLAF